MNKNYCKEKNNCCRRCFRHGHWTKDCYAKTDKFGDILSK